MNKGTDPHFGYRTGICQTRWAPKLLVFLSGFPPNHLKRPQKGKLKPMRLANGPMGPSFLLAKYFDPFQSPTILKQHKPNRAAPKTRVGHSGKVVLLGFIGVILRPI